MIFIRSTIIFISLILLWQLLVMIFQFPPYILPSPNSVLHTGWENLALICTQSLFTISETLIGFVLGIAFGCFTAIMMTLFQPFRLWLLPLLIISQAIPIFAIAPILVIWFGYGMTSKIVTTILMIFFPITSSFYDGLRRTPQGMLDLAYVMHAKPINTLFHLRIPAALPQLASGIRVAATIAPIGAVVGEWVGASQGLGFLMLNANARMEIALMFASLFTIILLALVLYFGVDYLLRKLIFWENV